MSCLLCFSAPPSPDVNPALQTLLEQIIRRKIQLPSEQPALALFCPPCAQRITVFHSALRRLEEEREELRVLVDERHPQKRRGRKKRNKEERQERQEKEETTDFRRSGRMKRPKREFQWENQKIQAKEKDGPSCCPYCPFSGPSTTELEKHLLQLHPEEAALFSSEARPHTCDLCGKSFTVRSNLVLHAKTHHIMEKPFSCDKCEKSFKQRSSLREHVLKNHDQVKLFPCGFCEETFMTRHLLRVHERIHTNDESFTCKTCGKQFASRQNLNNHQSVHSGQYAHTCPVCSKGFNCRTLLHEHSLVHTGEKRYACTLCDRRFANRGTFWLHKKQHADKKPFSCETCGRAYRHRSHLAVHRRSHTGEKPHQCRVCQRAFATSTHLRRHTARAHPKEAGAFYCGDCGMSFNKKPMLAEHERKYGPGHLSETVVQEESVEPEDTQQTVTYTLVESVPESSVVATETTVFKLDAGASGHQEDITTAANLIEFQSGSQASESVSAATGGGQTYTVVDIDGMGNIQAVKEGVEQGERKNESLAPQATTEEVVQMQQGEELQQDETGEFSTVLFVVRE